MVHLAQHIENIKNLFFEIYADLYEIIFTIKISIKKCMCADIFCVASLGFSLLSVHFILGSKVVLNIDPRVNIFYNLWVFGSKEIP